jgi:hypothetical protein
VPAGGGGGGMTDVERQNLGLTQIYQSKLFATFRRLVNVFATGFKGANDTANGIDAGSSSNYVVTPGSAGAADGYVAPSLGAGTTVTINSTSTTEANQTNTYIDRTTAVLNSVIVSKVGMYSTTARSITLKIVKRNSANNYDVVVNETFSHTGSGWEDFTLSSSYTVPGTGTYYLGSYVPAGGSNPNVTGTVSRAYLTGGSLTGTGVATTGEDSAGAVRPTRYVHTVSPSNMTVVTASQTSDASVSNGRALIEFDNTATPALNTDLTAEVSCNGGSNWHSGTLASVTSNSQSGRKLAETDDVACTSGTSFKLRVKTANNKDVKVYGLKGEFH